MKQKTVAETVCAYCRIDENCVNDVREENKTMRAVVRKTTVRMTACYLSEIKKIDMCANISNVKSGGNAKTGIKRCGPAPHPCGRRYSR